MSNIRIKDLTTTAATTASDDFVAVDGTTNGTRKLNAYSPTFGGNLTVSGTQSSFAASTLVSGTRVTINTGVAQGIDIYRNDANANFTAIRFRDTTNANTNAQIGWNGTQLRLDSTTALLTGATTVSGNLTVSGTGTSSFGGPISAASDSLFATRIRINASGQNQMFGDGNQFAVAGGSALLGIRNDQGAIVFAAGSSSVQLYLNTSGNALFGTNLVTDSGNGRIQLASHTTSAGGIGFGTDTSLFRSSAGRLALNGASAGILYFYEGGSEKGYIGTASSVLYIGSSGAANVLLQTNATTALTLDSSQRCILAGALRLNNAYVSGAPTATGYVTIQDSAGNTYKVLVGT